MAQITFKGNPINTIGELPAEGEKAPGFVLIKTDLSELSLTDYAGKKVVLNIFPSIDTPVCAASVRKFNAEVSSLENTVVLCISMDLPFAQSRFCGAEGLKNVVPASDFRARVFGDRYGLRIVDGPLSGLLARAVIVVDEDGSITYSQLVPEIAREPDYDKVIAAING